MDLKADFNKIEEYLIYNFKSYRHRASNGQKSGIHYIDDKLIVELYFYDDTSLCVETQAEKEYFIENHDTLIVHIFNAMLEHIAEKEQEYKKFLEYQRLNKELSNKQPIKQQGAKV